MFTRNYDNLIMMSGIGQQGTANATGYADENTTVSRAENGSYYAMTAYEVSATGIWVNSYMRIHEQLSTEQDSDVSPASYNDWWINHTLATSKYTFLTSSFNITTEDGVKYLNVMKRISNTSNDSFKVRGFGFSPYCKTTTSGGQQYFLCYHEVWDAPITVAPGESLDIKVKVALPNFRPNKPSA